MFRTVPLVVLAVSLFALSVAPGCASVQRVGQDTLECAAPELVDAAKDLAPVLLDALVQPTNDWSQAVDRIVLAAGAAGICAFRAVLAELQARAEAPVVDWKAVHYAGPDRADALRLTRAQQWARANGL